VEAIADWHWNLAFGYGKEFTDTEIRFRNNLFGHIIGGGPAAAIPLSPIWCGLQLRCTLLAF